MNKNVEKILIGYPKECLSKDFSKIKCKTPLDVVALYQETPIQAFQIMEDKGLKSKLSPPSKAYLVLDGIEIQIPTYRLYVNGEKEPKVVSSQGKNVDFQKVINYAEAQRWMLANVIKNCKAKRNASCYFWYIAVVSLMAITCLYIYTAIFQCGNDTTWLSRPFLYLVTLYILVLIIPAIKNLINNKL